MNTDFRVSVGFAHHHKTKKLMRRAGAEGVLALVFLWGHAAQNRPDGNLEGWSDEDFAIAGQWPGDPEKFVCALVEVGFIDGQAGQYRLHDWEKHNGYVCNSQKRSEIAKANIGKRWEKRAAKAGLKQGNTNGNTDGIAPVYGSDTPSPSPSPSPSPNPNPSKKKEDVMSGKPTRHASLINQEWLATIKDNPGYRGIDIEREYHRMMAWLETPRGKGKQPTKARFLNWLSKCEPTGPVEPELSAYEESVRELEAMGYKKI